MTILSERYGGNRPPRRDYEGRPANGARRPSGARYTSDSSRSARTGRPANRPPQGGRPAPRSYGDVRRPAPRRRKKSPAPKILLALVILAVIVLAIVFVPKLFKRPSADPSTTLQTAVVSATQQPTVQADVQADAPTDSTAQTHTTLNDYLNDDDAAVQGLSDEELVQVSNLSINESLPQEWLNVLLLGTDERNKNESARSDTMIICSVNKNTGEVKLTSIMRDLAVELTDLGKNSGTYRINAANYFGGPEYAMKIVNECFDMNIQHYVSINFYGFQDIAQALGGISVDITQEEMVEINRLVWTAHVASEANGYDDSYLPLVELTEYGKGVQLDARQTLAFARIRKTDNDYARAGRQRETLSKLAQKLKEKSPAEITIMFANFSGYVQTNMEFNEAASLALKVLQGDMGNISGFRLPIEGSYTAKTVNEKSMLYDCDWTVNARDLYTFIYS